MRQTYLSLGGGPRVLKATASPNFAAGCPAAAPQAVRGGRVGGVPWRNAVAVVLDTRGSFLSGADRQKDGRAVFSKEGA